MRLRMSCGFRAGMGAVVMGAAALLAPAPALADGLVVTVREHRFEPAELKVPANRRLAITWRNLDLTAEEIALPDLKLERVLVPMGEITLLVGPLKPGRHVFFGKFHANTARGVLVVGDAVPPGAFPGGASTGE